MKATFDVLIIGAGMCGATAARSLGDAGYSVGLIDPQPACRPVFKAEKLEPDQIELLRKLGSIETALSVATPIHDVTIGSRGKVDRIEHVTQYGVTYEDLVNAMRQSLRENVVNIRIKAVTLVSSETEPAVVLANGDRLTARIIIISNGVSGSKLAEKLGVAPTYVSRHHSLCCGFDMEPADRDHFDFEALTYHCEDRRKRADYITIFPVQQRMRANLFHYGSLKESWTREIVKDPFSVVGDMFPGLAKLTGKWRATSQGQTVAIQLYTMENPQLDGLLFLGDSFQSVCPATGTGLSKVLNDVYLSTRFYIPKWLEHDAITASFMAEFYSDQRKRRVDERSLNLARNRRNMIVSTSLRWRLRRARSEAYRLLNGIRSSN